MTKSWMLIVLLSVAALGYSMSSTLTANAQSKDPIATLINLPTTTVTIHVTINNGNAPTGAVIYFVNEDALPEHAYTFTVPASGIVSSDVESGYYDLSATLSGCSPYEQPNILVDGSVVELALQFTETLVPVTNFQAAQIAPGQAQLTWDAPASSQLYCYQLQMNGNIIEDNLSIEMHSYTVSGLAYGTYNFTITVVYTTGTSAAVTTSLTGTGDPNTEPAITALTGNSPNPFNPTTTIAYSLAKSEPVSLTVYNLRGQKVTTLVNNTQSAGKHTVTWNGTDANGHAVASGVYFYRMEAGNYSETQKMMMLK